MRTLFQGKREYCVYGKIVVSRSTATKAELITSLRAIDQNHPWVDDEVGQRGATSIRNISGDEVSDRDGPYIVVTIIPGTAYMRRGQLSAYTKYLNNLGANLWKDLYLAHGSSVVGLYAEIHASKLAFLVS